MPDKMDQISKDACDLNYRDSVQGQIIFPVSNGVILQTFKLEHNAPTTSISFHLKDDVYSSLFTK